TRSSASYKPCSPPGQAPAPPATNTSTDYRPNKALLVYSNRDPEQSAKGDTSRTTPTRIASIGTLATPNRRRWGTSSRVQRNECGQKLRHDGTTAFHGSNPRRHGWPQTRHVHPVRPPTDNAGCFTGSRPVARHQSHAGHRVTRSQR